MVLQPSDLENATVTSQGFTRANGFVIGYSRSFGPVGTGGHVVYLQVHSTVLLARDATRAGSLFGVIETAFARGRFDAFAVSALSKPSARGLKLRVGHVHKLAVGASAFFVPMRVEAKGHFIPLDIVLVRVDRVIGLIGAVGMPDRPIAMSNVKVLATTQASHTAAGLLPAVASPPTISGTPVQGQTLTAAPGTWSNSPDSYSYQWQLCDATGAGCTPIANATGPTYVPTSTEVGATLTVTVTAVNSEGQSAPVSSVATGIVS
jgi:hypothetical protein